jgi:spore coat protein A, manganese oxidase
MDLKSRRNFLKLGLASMPGLVLSSGLDASQSADQSSSRAAEPAFRTPDAITRYLDPLPIPRRLMPVSTSAGRLDYHVRMLEFSQKMHSQLPPTRLWGYEGQYPGPIFDVTRGTAVQVTWENLLPRHHLFAIDPHIHGAMSPAPAVRTVPHLHGSRTSSASDGLPEKWFAPGHAAVYHYPNQQIAATLWYHDHAVGITRLNVYAGLSGFYLLRDEQERSLNLPQGDYEIPLLLQDRTLDEKGQLVYAPFQDTGEQMAPGKWGPQFFGELPVVNGAIYPYLQVEPRPYRLRVLNGSNSRFLNLFFNTAKGPADIPALIAFHQIGTDGGLLPVAAPLSKLLLAPAERADLIIDFSAHAGKVVTLSNNAPAPYPGWALSFAKHPVLYEFMQFLVDLPLRSTATAFSLPAALPFAPPQDAKPVRTRDFILSERMDPQGKCLGVLIDGKGYDQPVSEQVALNSTEEWRFINTTDDAHPMHLHLVQFRLVQRQGFNLGALLGGTLQFEGVPRLPAAHEAGWKDTAVVNPGEVLTIRARFEGYTGRYVFHCHMLEHEDNDMMRPFEVVGSAALS